MMLIRVTICDNEGRDASALLDISRLTAVVPLPPNPPTMPYPFSNERGRPRNRNYLEVWIDTNRWVVLASEWPRIKAALARVNGASFNRFDNDTEGFECPHYLQTPTTDATTYEETADLSRVTNGIYASLRRDLSANVATVGVDTETEAATCSSSR